jgi:signal peptidase II
MRRYVSIFLFIFLVFADQFSKYLIRQTGGFYVCNKNLAFGVNVPDYLFYPVWIVIVLVVFYFLPKNGSLMSLGSAAFIFVLSGALGNILDRFYFGCVIDFVDLKFWPIFNLADIFIIAGVIIIITSLLKKKDI